jgi:hypothetical protein
VSNPDTFTAEHRSWQWELVLQYEDGSLPADKWNTSTLAVVAGWYATTLPADQARARYAQYYQRNRRRLSNRLDQSSVPTEAIEALDAAWESLLEQRLPKASEPDIG